MTYERSQRSKIRFHMFFYLAPKFPPNHKRRKKTRFLFLSCSPNQFFYSLFSVQPFFPLLPPNLNLKISLLQSKPSSFLFRFFFALKQHMHKRFVSPIFSHELLFHPPEPLLPSSPLGQSATLFFITFWVSI